MTKPAILAFVFALFLSACSLPSFEEREATRSNDEQTTEAEDDDTAVSTTDPSGPVVLGDTDPTSDLPPPTWAALQLETVLIAEYDAPISIVDRSGTDDLYVAQRNGVIRRIQRTFNSRGAEKIASDTRIVLDISEMVSTDSERGLLDIAFSLDGRALYVSYTDLAGDSVITEYDIDRSSQANAGSARELLRVAQPFGNHNGGDLEFGADGFLYIGLGDGGSSGDPEGNGQNRSSLLGSILRIDPVAGGERPYLIPDGNPFVDGGGAPEVFLYGVRNPWRFSFDSANGDLWIADVGQNSFEEINVLTAASGGGKGANLGWNRMEAFTSFDGASEPADHVPPIYAYPHGDGRCSITGGHVYHGELIPLLEGVYVFGDYCSGELWGLERTAEGPVVRQLPIDAPRNELVSIGTARDGELYLVASGGQILRVQPAPAAEETEG